MRKWNKTNGDTTVGGIDWIMSVQATCVTLLSCFLMVVAKDNQAGLRLAGAYFKSRDVGAINIFMCSINETYKMMRYLMFHRQTQFSSVASGLSLLNEPQKFLHLMSVYHYKLGVYLDYSCEFGKHIIKKCSEHHMLNASYSWLIWSGDRDVLVELDSLNFGLDSEAVLAVPDGTLWDLYKVNYTTTLNATLAGCWSNTLGLHIFLNGTKIQRRSNFHGIHFKGTVVLTKLESNSSNAEKYILDTTHLPHLDSVSRFAFILFQKLRDVYNFTFSFQVTESWGYIMPHGGHDGMVGHLERGEIDIGLTPATMFVHRMDTVDFVHPVWKFRTCFIFRHPSTLGAYKALMKPLTPSAWIFTGALLAIVVAALRLIHYYDVSDWVHTEHSWSSSIVLVVGAIAQQGLSQTSYRISVRILSLFVLILSVVVYAFYGAAIVTSLLTPPPKTIKTIPQLLDNSISLGVENTAYTRDYFSKSTDALTAKLYKKKLKTPTGFMTIPNGIEKMRTSVYAFYAEDATLYRPIDKIFSNVEKCALTEIELFAPYLVSSPVQKGSPLKDFISCGFLLMRERGILYRENKVWHPRRPQCVDEKLVARVDLESVMLAFIVLIGGIVLSFMILLGERAAYKMRCQQKIVKLMNCKLTRGQLKENIQA